MSAWRKFVHALPLGLALAGVTAVWCGGAVWSFEEQARLAGRLLFAVPQLLPLVLDGLAVSLAGVAYAASLDGRAAVQARLMTAVAVLASAGSNAAGAWSRTDGDPLAVTIAAGVPVAANLAFEVLLGELRRQVHRHRGLPAPVAIPYPRIVRLMLAPVPAAREWRRHVLELTGPAGAPVPDLPEPVPLVAERGPVLTVDPEPHPSGKPKPTPARRKRVVPAKTATRGTRAATTTGAKAAKPAPGLPADVMATGRLVAAELEKAGKSLTHRSLIAGFRARESPLSSDRAQSLMQVLRSS